MVSDFSTLTPLSGSVLWTVSANSLLVVFSAPFFRPNKGLSFAPNIGRLREFSLAAVAKQRKLKIRQICYLTVLKVRGPKWVTLSENHCVSGQCSLVEAQGENSHPCLFELLEAVLKAVSCAFCLCFCCHISACPPSISHLKGPL